jgi:hypothetical protein
MQPSTQLLIDQLSEWMDSKEKSFHSESPLHELKDGMDQTLLETDFLLQASDQLLCAYSHVMEIYDNH